ncbi:aldo/keto reductase [Mycobacterium talmoniae]|uniref:General stress protein n=1 Tax=Mycobacterium talmoniae TaxID=1858794 RepID=A0A1S1NFG4_9MYCO|nr:MULTISPECIES: aldo/keto reductase [Mycobacterium]OHV04408.1 general stress protein [Mycobacterium talmoniae]PQM46929.1 General stress protein 69 [Mycobacterium talmoniae]TDH48735.1 aldo/keto reductase [Mycobacterium eburneum]
MKTNMFGNTGLEVSRLAFGTWAYGGDWGRFDEDAAITMIRRARELGFNFFDTAQQYGFGESERILGKALRDDLTRNRDEVVIATKGGLRPTADGLVRDASPEWLRRGVDSSLNALGVDHIDFYLVHWPDPTVPAAETAGALKELVAAGKIRHVGVSNYDTKQIEEFSATLPVEAVQPPYHLFRRDIEDELLPYCRAHNIGVFVYGPLAHGLLTGTIHPDTTFADNDWRSKSDVFRGDGFKGNLVVVDQLSRLAADLGVTISQLAIAWTLAQPGVNVAIVGAQHLGYLQDSAGAADVSLSEADLAAIEEIMAAATPVGGPTPEMSREAG